MWVPFEIPLLAYHRPHYPILLPSLQWPLDCGGRTADQDFFPHLVLGIQGNLELGERERQTDRKTRVGGHNYGPSTLNPGTFAYVLIESSQLVCQVGIRIPILQVRRLRLMDEVTNLLN